MLSPIDRSARIHTLAAVIRRAVAERGRKSSPASKQDRPTAADAGTLSLIERARAIPASHPRRSYQALRVFIEGILLDEFGNRLSTDPHFQSMVDEILTALEHSPEYGEDCRRLADALLGENETGA